MQGRIQSETQGAEEEGGKMKRLIAFIAILILCPVAFGAGGLTVGNYNNNSGLTIATGSVVVRATGADSSVKYITTTTSAADATVVGVTAESIENGATGYVTIAGQAVISTTNEIAQGNCLYTTTTAGDCDDTGTSATPGAGCFGFALTGKSAGAGTFIAMIYPSTLTDVVSDSVTLDSAFDNGKIINGANSAGNAVQIGDGTDALLFYTDSGVPKIATNGTSDMIIAPDGGDTNVTGNLATTGTAQFGDTDTGAVISISPSAGSGDSVAAMHASRGFVGYSNGYEILQGKSGKGIKLLVNNDTFASGSGFVLDSSANGTLAGDLTVTGNDIKNSDGENTITMNADQDVTLNGQLIINYEALTGGIMCFRGNEANEATGWASVTASATIANQNPGGDVANTKCALHFSPNQANGFDNWTIGALMNGNNDVDLYFTKQNAVRMVMDNAGNVGIGTDTTPDYWLDVQGTLGVDGALSFLSTTTGTNAAHMKHLDDKGIIYGTDGDFGQYFDSADGCLTIDHVTGPTDLLKLDSSGNLSLKAGQLNYKPVAAFSANDTTPSVAGGNVFSIPATWTALNDITDFDDGVNGQMITIIGGDSDCNIGNNANILFNAATDWNGAVGMCVSLVYDGSVWHSTGY